MQVRKGLNRDELYSAVRIALVAVGVGDVEDDAPLMDAGIDSLMAIDFRRVLSSCVCGIRLLPAVLIFDHPTTALVVDFLSS